MIERIDALRQRMAEKEIDAGLVVWSRDLYYYTGTARPGSLLLAPGLARLFVRRGHPYAQAEASLHPVERGGRFGHLNQLLLDAGLSQGRLGTELDLVPAALAERLASAFPTFELVDLSPLILAQRACKEPDEIERLRGSVRVIEAGHQRAMAVAAPGVSELELSAEVEAAMRRAGSEGPMPLRGFDTRVNFGLVVSGENLKIKGGHGLVTTGEGLGPPAPYGASNRTLREGDLFLVDMAVPWRGYVADETRTYVLGRAAERQRTQFAAARAVQDAVLQALRPGVTPAELYAIAEEVVGQAYPPYFQVGDLTLPGFIGHGVGLEGDEPPVLWSRDKAPMRAGMTLAIEIEVDSEALGTVKLEDTALITESGAELLTTLPRELIEIKVNDIHKQTG